MDHLLLIGLFTTILLVFQWKARGYDWTLVDSIGQPSNDDDGDGNSDCHDVDDTLLRVKLYVVYSCG